MKTSGRNFSRFTVSAARVASVLLAGGLLAACQQTSSVNKASRSIPSDTLALMERKGTTKSSPIVIRAYKKEAELEVWKMKGDGEYVHIKTFPMCRWSGQLGPKRREGDRQVPEGFYAITPGQMNPNSQYHLSFNVGYPNALDRVQGFTGGAIMVHGACSSAGCFSMTDQQIEEIYAIAREAFAGGQRQIQMQSYPFRMTPENLAKHRLDPNMAFWRTLKEGSDRFEVTKREPQVAYCGRRYVFDATSATGESLSPGAVCPPLRQDPQIAELVAEKARADDAKVAELVKSGVQPVKMVYHDGGQHPSMAHVMEVSRPEALVEAPRLIPLDPQGRPLPAAVQVAAARQADVPAPVTTAPARDVVAPAPAAPAVPVTQAGGEASMVSRLFSFTPSIPSLFGSSEAAKATQAAAPVPLPPPRPRALLDAKPQASLITEPPVRMVAPVPARRVAGAAPILGNGLSQN
jgi:murein L,D-transpeptidase YafK